MKLRLDSIDLDVSIQCRANIDTGTVNEYAECMTEGNKFPPIIVFGTEKKSWIGDGWHRVLAGKQIALVKIDADLRSGSRIDALKHALQSNTLHGNRRNNADKRRCVEIALREFSKLSDVQIGKLCGVADTTVATYRPVRVGNTEPEKRTGSDGKQYPARRELSEPPHGEKGEETPTPESKDHPIGPPCMGMEHARLAISHLEDIKPNDSERKQALIKVKGWCEEHGA